MFSEIETNAHVCHSTLNRSVDHCWLKAVIPWVLIANDRVFLFEVRKVLSTKVE